MPSWVIRLLLVLSLSVLSAGARAEKRVALVVGNAHYEFAPTLHNPLNDAKDMAELLKSLGFNVLLGTDLDQRGFAGIIERFRGMLAGADVALFFYAGHGLQMNGQNYLVSTKAKLENEFLIPAETIAVDAVVQMMESRSRLNMVFLDACRNNPLADSLRRNLVAESRSASLGRGLARIEPAGPDTLVAYSAAPGQEAQDGKGRNSPFTSALLKTIPKSGLEVSVMLKEVAAEVRTETNNAQRPQQLSDMTHSFYFVPPAPAPAPAPLPPPAPVSDKPARAAGSGPDHSVEIAYWDSARAANDCQSVRAYVSRYPAGLFIELAKLREDQLCTASATRIQPQAPAVPDKIAALPQSTPEAPPRADQTKIDIARELQRELIRAGCSAGEPDGVWGRRSRDALREFGRFAKLTIDSDDPSPEALDTVRHHPGTVCHREPARERNAEPAARQRPARRGREPAAAVARAPRSKSADWRSLSPLCQSQYFAPGRTCCTYDSPGGAPRILCR
jgi:uncharacterized caspase-like protein